MAMTPWFRKKPTPAGSEDYWCGFCGKNRRKVKALVTADSGVCICDECIMLSVEILLETGTSGAPAIETIPDSEPRPLDRESLRGQLDELEDMLRDLRRHLE